MAFNKFLEPLGGKKNFIVLSIVIGSVFVLLGGCSSILRLSTRSTKKAETTVTSVTSVAETVPETTTIETTTVETTIEETTTSETTTEETTESETVAVAIPKKLKNFINYKDMHFFVNGKKYTLGKTTLQKMIDDGVPFNEVDIANKDNVLKKNFQSPAFRIELGESWSAQLYVINASKKDKKMSECCINKITLSNKPDKTQNILSFDFPLDISADDLTDAIGKPKKDNYKHIEDEANGTYSDKYTYKSKAGKYIRGSSYQFTFVKGDLDLIEIEYMP